MKIERRVRAFTRLEKWWLICSVGGSALLFTNVVAFNVVHYPRPLYFVLLGVFAALIAMGTVLLRAVHQQAHRHERAYAEFVAKHPRDAQEGQ